MSHLVLFTSSFIIRINSGLLTLLHISFIGTEIWVCSILCMRSKNSGILIYVFVFCTMLLKLARKCLYQQEVSFFTMSDAYVCMCIQTLESIVRCLLLVAFLYKRILLLLLKSYWSSSAITWDHNTKHRKYKHNMRWRPWICSTLLKSFWKLHYLADVAKKEDEDFNVSLLPKYGCSSLYIFYTH